MKLSKFFSCSCSAGYQGVTCEVEINECESSPCFNNATCVDQLAAFQCECVNGFEGMIVNLFRFI